MRKPHQPPHGPNIDQASNAPLLKGCRGDVDWKIREVNSLDTRRQSVPDLRLLWVKNSCTAEVYTSHAALQSTAATSSAWQTNTATVDEENCHGTQHCRIHLLETVRRRTCAPRITAHAPSEAAQHMQFEFQQRCALRCSGPAPLCWHQCPALVVHGAPGHFNPSSTPLRTAFRYFPGKTIQVGTMCPRAMPRLQSAEFPTLTFWKQTGCGGGLSTLNMFQAAAVTRTDEFRNSLRTKEHAKTGGPRL